MAQSHREIVPVSIIEDADISHLPKTDMTVLMIKAIAAACKAEPAMNAWFDGQHLGIEKICRSEILVLRWIQKKLICASDQACGKIIG